VAADVAATFLVQDEGSQLVAKWAGVTPGERVLDVCASPGGKTVVIADDLGIREAGSGSLLVAGDRRPGRVDLLEATLDRAGLAVPILALDALRPLPFGSVFDCVVLDAPCSGLGTLRRDPDLKWSRQESDLARLAADQRMMLTHAADVVCPGGRLVYSTCSSEPDENDDVIEAFLATDTRFTLAPREASGLWADLLDGRGNLRTTPFRHGLDAYYAATLVRRVGT
jgi:16S rRNA (cytosine967-C5)-methyltransferase